MIATRKHNFSCNLSLISQNQLTNKKQSWVQSDQNHLCDVKWLHIDIKQSYKRNNGKSTELPLYVQNQMYSWGSKHFQSNLALNVRSRLSYLLSRRLSIPFSSGIDLPLLINSRFDCKSCYEKCFSLAIESSIF